MLSPSDHTGSWYNKGAQILSEMEKTGRMALFTHCAGIIGAMSIGCMIAMWVSINCPLQFTLSGSEIIIQDYLNQIMPKRFRWHAH